MPISVRYKLKIICFVCVIANKVSRLLRHLTTSAHIIRAERNHRPLT